MLDDTGPRLMSDKIWDCHKVQERPDGQTLLYVDCYLVHDGSAPAVSRLAERGFPVRKPSMTFATLDHYVPTSSRDVTAIDDPERCMMVERIAVNTAREGIMLFGLNDPRQGIVHVVGPEEGLSQPGAPLVCRDNHTSTHDALGALASGIGSSELRYSLGMPDEAARVGRATRSVLAAGLRTADMHEEGTRRVGTSEMGDAVVAALDIAA